MADNQKQNTNQLVISNCTNLIAHRTSKLTMNASVNDHVTTKSLDKMGLPNHSSDLVKKVTGKRKQPCSDQNKAVQSGSEWDESDSQVEYLNKRSSKQQGKAMTKARNKSRAKPRLQVEKSALEEAIM